jgi:hypothetical protein
VAKADKEDHDQEEHSSVTCSNCNFTEVKYKYGNHDSECEMKPKPCEFCDKTIEIADFNTHYQLCGSKT